MLTRIKIRRLIKSIITRKIFIKTSRLNKRLIIITRINYIKKPLLTLLTSLIFILFIVTIIYSSHLK